MTAVASAAEKPIQVEVGLPAGDRLRLFIETNDGIIAHAELSGSGCSALLALMSEWRPKLTGELSAIPLPAGSDHSAMLFRELILKAQGRWRFPYTEAEICHCRAVPTAKVDGAVVSGCHTLQRIRDATSASTSCGACRPDIEAVITYRLDRKATG